MLSEMYADDSGGEDQAALVLGGVLATAQAWDDFFEDWDEVLARAPSVPWWRMSDARARKPPFDVLTSTQQWDRELELAHVLRRHALRGIGLVLSVDYWNKHGRGKVDVSGRNLPDGYKQYADKMYDTPHHVLINTLYAATRMIVRENKLLDKVHIIIEKDKDDEDHKHSEQFVQATLDMEPWHRYSRGRGVIGDIRFSEGKSAETRPLEAADMWAWSVRRFPVLKKPDEKIWEILREIPSKIINVNDYVHTFLRDMNNAR